MENYLMRKTKYLSALKKFIKLPKAMKHSVIETIMSLDSFKNKNLKESGIID